MNHLKKYWGWYLGGIILIVVLVSSNWEKITQWWNRVMSPNGTGTGGQRTATLSKQSLINQIISKSSVGTANQSKIRTALNSLTTQQLQSVLNPSSSNYPPNYCWGGYFNCLGQASSQNGYQTCYSYFRDCSDLGIPW